MPYQSKAEKERAKWWTIGEAIQHIRNVDGCTADEALEQLRKAMHDDAILYRWENAVSSTGGWPLPVSDSYPSDWLTIPINAAHNLVLELAPNDPSLTEEGKARYKERWRRLLVYRESVITWWPTSAPQTAVGIASHADGTMAGRRPSEKAAREFVAEYIRLQQKADRTPTQSGLWRQAVAEHFGATRDSLWLEFKDQMGANAPGRGRVKKSRN